MAEPKVALINSFVVEWWDIERPKDYSLNARKWKPAAVAKVADSIKRYGWRQPIVVDDAGVIVIGHLRRAAARQAGLTQVPVHVAAGLSPEAIRGLRLADNRTHDEAEWDMELLAREFGELKAIDYDLSATQFDMKEIARFDPISLSSISSLGDLQHRIVVECNSEKHQAELLERFQAEGLICQALIS